MSGPRISPQNFRRFALLLGVLLLVLVSASCRPPETRPTFVERDPPAFQMVSLACTNGSEPIESCFTDEWYDARPFDAFSVANLSVSDNPAENSIIGEDQVADYLLRKVVQEPSSGKYSLERCTPDATTSKEMLASAFEVKTATSDGSITTKIYERIVSDTRAEIATALGGKVEGALAATITEKITSKLLTKLEGSDAIVGNGHYIKKSVSSGWETAKAFRALCSGYPVVDGLKALAVEKLEVNKDKLSKIDFADVVDVALSASAGVTEELKATLKLGLQKRWEFTRNTLNQQRWSSKVLIPIAFSLRPIANDSDAEAEAKAFRQYNLFLKKVITRVNQQYIQAEQQVQQLQQQRQQQQQQQQQP